MIGETSVMMAMRDPDIRLMLRVRADDSKAFSELVEKFQTRLVGLMHHILAHKQDAEDLAQEVFMRVYRNRHNYSPKAKFSTWLFTIANNLALNAIRDRKRRKTLSIEQSESSSHGVTSQSFAPPSRGPAPDHQADQTELAEVIRRAMGELNERQRMAVVLNKFEDMSYAEIAEVMGLSEKAVKSLLSRARQQLRARLRNYITIDRDPTLLKEDSVC
jgi:RNA polymerase sigma-70 factor (ECF subfamily)